MALNVVEHEGTVIHPKLDVPVATDVHASAWPTRPDEEGNVIMSSAVCEAEVTIWLVYPATLFTKRAVVVRPNVEIFPAFRVLVLGLNVKDDEPAMALVADGMNGIWYWVKVEDMTGRVAHWSVPVVPDKTRAWPETPVVDGK